MVSNNHQVNIKCNLSDDFGYVPYVVTNIPFTFYDCDIPNKTMFVTI